MTLKEELGAELTREKIKTIDDVGKHGAAFVAFENGMEFIIGGRWLDDGKYDKYGNYLNVRKFQAFPKEEEKINFYFSELKQRKEYEISHPEYFRLIYKPLNIYGVKSEIKKLVANAVKDYFKHIPENYKGIKIVYPNCEKDKSGLNQSAQTKNPENDSPNTSGLNNQGEGLNFDQQKVNLANSKKSPKVTSQVSELQQQSSELNLNP